MPRVPNYQPNQVGPVELTQARLRPADNDGGVFGAVGKGMQDLGNTLAWKADQQDRLNAQNDDTQARLLTAEAGLAYTTATTEYTQLAAGAAREGQAEYSERLAKIRDEALTRAGNPRMKRLLEERLTGIHDASSVQIARHAIQQQKVEREAGFGAQASAYSEMAASTDDPALRDQYVASAIAVQRDKLVEIDGMNPEVVPELFAIEELKISSAVHGSVVDRLFAVPDPDVDEVMNYLDAYGDEMTAALRSSVMGRVQDPLQGRMARADVDVALGFLPASEGAPAPVSGAKPVLVHDGGEIAQSIFGDRANITSTYRSADHPLSKKNPNSWHTKSRAAVDMAPIAGMTFEQAKAEIEGKGFTLIEALNETGKGKSKHATGEHWHFVIGAGGGQESGYTPAPREWDRTAVYSAIDHVAEREGWNPERTERARQEADRRINKDEGLLQEQQADAYDSALNIVAGSGDGFRSHMIPADVKAKMTPRQWADIMDIEKRLTAPKEVSANGAAAIGLSLMPYYEPEKFKTMNLAQFAGQVTNAELESMMVKQAQMRNQPDSAEKWNPRSGIVTALNYGKKINAMDLEPAQEAAILGIMEAEATRLYQANGKKPLTENDYQSLFRSATRSVQTNKSFLGISTGRGEKPRYDLSLSTMPQATKERLTQRLERSGLPVNDENLLRLYRLEQ